MKKIYFSRINFKVKNGENDSNEIEKLKKLSVLELLERDLEHNEKNTIKEENKEVTELAKYNPAGSEYYDDTKLTGSLIKTGQVITKFYNRETAEIEEIDPKDTEYKITYIYDSISGIIAYRITSSFGEEQFNKAFQDILKQAMLRTMTRTEFPFEIPDFEIEVDSIYNNLNMENLEAQLKLIEPIKEIKVNFLSNNIEVQCKKELTKARVNEFEVKLKSDSGLNLDSDEIKEIYIKINRFLKKSEEIEELDLKAKITFSVKTMLGDCYSNLKYSKFKHNISDSAKLPEFYTKSLNCMENLLNNELVK